ERRKKVIIESQGGQERHENGNPQAPEGGNIENRQQKDKRHAGGVGRHHAAEDEKYGQDHAGSGSETQDLPSREFQHRWYYSGCRSRFRHRSGVRQRAAALVQASLLAVRRSAGKREQARWRKAAARQLAGRTPERAGGWVNDQESRTVA